MPQKFTPLYSEHKNRGAVFTELGGWQTPLKYSSELAEHLAVREAAGLFDSSHMGQFVVQGPDAAPFLDYALVGMLSTLAAGKARYSLMCAEDGGIIDDLISYRISDDQYVVVPNASNSRGVFNALAIRSRGFDVTTTDVSSQTSLITIHGPRSEEVLLKLVHETGSCLMKGLESGSFIDTFIAGRSALVARTTGTGEDGFDLFIGNQDAVTLWSVIEEAGMQSGLVPCGLAALGSLRLEAGIPLYGSELSRNTNPFAAGLGHIVALEKEGDFVGRSALEGFDAAGAGTSAGCRLVGLAGSAPRPPHAFSPVLKSGRLIGEVTSSAPSPTLGCSLAMAYIQIEHAEPGTQLQVDFSGKIETFEVTTLPFYMRQPTAQGRVPGPLNTRDRLDSASEVRC